MIHKNINYNHLHTFYLIAKSDSMSEAAQALGVSKPGLSVQIKKLEENLGLQLFDRTGKSFKLTHHGAKVLSYVNKMFEYSDAMVRTLSVEKSSNKERVTIGITPDISRSYAVKALVPLLKSDSLIPKIKEGGLDHLQWGLTRGEIDLILSEDQLTLNNSQQMVRTPVGKNSYVFVGAKKFKNLEENFPQSLNECEIFTFSETNPVRVKIDHFLFSNKLKVNFFGETDSIEFIKKAVGAGLCIAALPMWFVKDQVANGELFVIGSLAGESEDVIITYKNYNNVNRIKEVIKLLTMSGE